MHYITLGFYIFCIGSLPQADMLDGQSEDLGSKFSNGEIPLQDFLKSYLETRTSYHALKAKLECVDKSGK